MDLMKYYIQSMLSRLMRLMCSTRVASLSICLSLICIQFVVGVGCFLLGT